LIDQRLQLLARLGAILHYGANLIEQVQSLVNLALRIGRVGTLLGRHGRTGDASIAGVIGAIPVAIAIAAAVGIASRTGDAVPNITCKRSAGLTCLASSTLASALTALTALTGLTTLTGLAALLTTWLTALTGLTAWLALLPRLTGLSAAELAAPLHLLTAGLAGLTLSTLRIRLRVGTSAKAGDLVAHTG
jgi:hypothetical protein